MEASTALSCAIAVSLTAAGYRTLMRAAPASRQRGMRLMLGLSTAGMLLGLLLDCAAAPWPASGWCGDVSAWTGLRLHWRQWPAMHAGMLGGGLAALPVLWSWHRPGRAWLGELACNLSCNAAMLAGMEIAMHLAARQAFDALPTLLAMPAGMLCGMAALAAAMRVRGVLRQARHGRWQRRPLPG